MGTLEYAPRSAPRLIPSGCARTIGVLSLDPTPYGKASALGCRLAARPDVTAIFVANDQMALGVLRALHDAGRRVPQDVSVVGFDDSPHGEFFNPPLTTVRQNHAELGRRSLELLLTEIEVGRHVRVHDTIPAELIVRASTAAASTGPPTTMPRSSSRRPE
jgi:DNA-binding LacI/PurR family transcriptional regulator